MSVDWEKFPEAVRLYERIAEIAQREYNDSITPAGTLADPDHLGHGIAAEIMRDAYDTLTHNGERVLVFLDPQPARS